MTLLFYRRVLAPRFSADHEATRLILNVSRTLAARGAHASTNGTSLTFTDFPGDARLSGLIDGSCTIDRSRPAEPTFVVSYTFRPILWPLAAAAGIMLVYVLWTARHILPALGCALLAVALLLVVTVAIGSFRLWIAISDGLRGAAG